MTLRSVLTCMVVLGPSLASATCIYPPPGAPHPEANAFLATVVSEEIIGGESSLRNGEYYRVKYTYRVDDTLRGNAKDDLLLYSSLMYSDPAAKEQFDVAEALAYAPGDTLLVAFDGESEIQAGMCTPSHQWKGSLSMAQKEWSR